MKNLSLNTIAILLLLGCSQVGNNVVVRYHEPECERLNFVTGSGRDEYEALEKAKIITAKLGGNILVPQPEGPLEIGLSHEVDGPTSTYISYNGTAFYCEPDRK